VTFVIRRALRSALAGAGAATHHGIVQVTFETDRQGRVTGLVVHFAGTDTAAPRLDTEGGKR